MIKIYVSRADAMIRESETLTSGRVGLQCGFEFSSDWTGLGKTAVFVAGSVTKTAVVSGNNIVEVPWECLENSGVNLKVGVYGTNADEADMIVIPTVWCGIDMILKGTEVSGTESASVTPTLAQQVLANSQAAVSAVITNVTVDDSEAGIVGTPDVTITDTTGVGSRTLNFKFANLKGATGATGATGPAGTTNWSDLTGKPSTFPPSAHNHAIADVTNLQATLTSQSEAIETLEESKQDTNLFDISTIIDNRVLASSGGYTVDDNCYISDAIHVYGNNVKIVWKEIPNDNYMRIGLYDASKTFISRTLASVSGTYEYTFENTNKCEYIRISARKNSLDSTSVRINLIDAVENQSSEIDTLQNAQSYSTSEVDTGATWIDGRHIYKKTLAVTGITAGTNKNIDVSSLGIAELLKIEGILYNDTSSMSFIPSFSASNSFNAIVFKNGDNLVIQTTSATGINRANITLEYVKTT